MAERKLLSDIIMEELAKEWAKQDELQERHCTHPNQIWCDCDWCRYLRTQESTNG